MFTGVTGSVFFGDDFVHKKTSSILMGAVGLSVKSHSHQNTTGFHTT